MKIKEAIILNYRCHSQTQRVGDEGDPTPQFNWFIKKSVLENFLKKIP